MSVLQQAQRTMTWIAAVSAVQFCACAQSSEWLLVGQHVAVSLHTKKSAAGMQLPVTFVSTIPLHDSGSYHNGTADKAGLACRCLTSADMQSRCTSVWAGVLLCTLLAAQQQL